MINLFNIFKKPKLKNWVEEIKYYESQGYYVANLSVGKMYLAVLSKDFKEGDEVYWLGHDGVFGCLYGQTYIADKEMVEKKQNLWFWKKIKSL